MNRKSWTSADIAWCRDNHKVGFQAMADHFGVKYDAIKTRYHVWRKAGHVPMIGKNKIGDITTVRCNGRLVQKQKTAEGWKYISSEAEGATTHISRKARAKRPMPVKQFKQQQEMKNKKPTPNKVQEQARTRARKEREEKARFKTRDHGKLIRVRIDRKTELLVPQERVAAIKANYKIAS